MKMEFRRLFVSARRAGQVRTPRFFRRIEGSELLEFALALPLILVMLVGLLDFAQAYHVKQVLANAAREGARVAISEPRAGLTGSGSPPDTVQSVKDDVTTYIQNAGINTSFINANATAASNLTWTYYTTTNCPSGTCGLKLEMNYQITDPNTGGLITAVRVTLTYPYNWTYGFNNVMKLLIPSSSIAGTIMITTDAAMPQLAG